MSQSVRFGLPESVIAGMTTLLTVVAMLINSPLLTLPLLVVAPIFFVAVRRYLKRAPMGYITEGGTYSMINSTLTETVEGARTVEALGLQDNRVRASSTPTSPSRPRRSATPWRCGTSCSRCSASPTTPR